VKLLKGKATVVGRKSDHSLYSKKLATYEQASSYDQAAAQGFIKIHGLSQQTQARRQLLKGGKGFELPGLMKPPRSDG
jgi:argininosuccinate synthase